MNIMILIKAILGICMSALMLAAIAFIGSVIPKYGFLVGIIFFFIIVYMAYSEAKKFKETEGQNGVVVYTDYYDVFKCLSIFLVPLIIMYIGGGFGQIKAAIIASILYSSIMTLHIAYISAKLNSLKMLPIIILVKLIISIIWVYALKEMLSPSGKNSSSRRDSRAIAVMILMVITPIINILILNKDGSALIQAQLRGRRFSGAKNLRDMLK